MRTLPSHTGPAPSGSTPSGSTPSDEESTPRKVLRLTVLFTLVVPLALVFYGSILLFPAYLLFALLRPTLGLWALAPAALGLAAGGLMIGLWVRAPANTRRGASIGMGIGSGFS